MSEIVRLKLTEIRPYERNPRKNDAAVDDVAESIRQCGYKAKIIVDENNVIIAGHTRWKALQQLGYTEVEVQRETDMTEEQKRKYRLLDNKVGEKSTWDFELLDWELEGLDFDGYDFEFEAPDDWVTKYPDRNEKQLADRYVAPPFSILDARGGTWQKRKKQWLEIIDSGSGRDNDLLGNGLNILADAANKNTKITGTSIFDPVLCETMLAWFCPEGGTVIDPFAGGSVRGLVSSYTGRSYTGVDLSLRQVEANEAEYEKLKGNKDFFGEPLAHPTWICGDSSNILQLAPGMYDFLLMCPPYADLEKYSDDERDLSNMDYADFLAAYNDIITKTVKLLRKDAFAAVVVGDVRGKDGYYYNFVSDTIAAFLQAGMNYYNECILVTPIGTAALRANNTFGRSRKVVKTHQNVLVFCRGDVRNIELGEYNYDFEGGDNDD